MTMISSAASISARTPDGSSSALPAASPIAIRSLPAMGRSYSARARRDTVIGDAGAERTLSEDHHGAAVVGAQTLLDGHVQVAEAFELAGVCERTRVDRAQSAVVGDLLDGVLRVVVVRGHEHVQRLAADPSLDKGAGERGVERLHDLCG